MSITPASSVLPATLADLKRTGGRLLVVGEQSAHQCACERLAGASSARRQHVVVTSGAASGECRHASGDETILSLDCGAHVSTLLDAEDSVETEPSLSALASAFGETVDARAAAGLVPSELRVCLGPVDRLMAQTDLTRVSQFLETVLERTIRVRGMAHVHVDADIDSHRVRTLRPLFDAIVEVRTDPVPRQRWHLVDRNATSQWLRFED